MPDVDGLLPHIRPGWSGVEIGVWKGHSSRALLDHGVAFLHLADPWARSEEYHEDLGDPEANYRETLGRLAGFDGRYRVLRMTSEEAAPLVPEVDFVWVDGNHRYGHVTRDLELYWPKVRPGGVLCGHDYSDAAGLEYCEVKRAVDDFCHANGLHAETWFPFFLIRK